MSGKLTPEVDQAIKRINEIRKDIGRDGELTSAQRQEINDLNVILQPFKPFAYGFEEYKLPNGDTMMIPVQHKSSEIVLIPELLPVGSKLRDMAHFMEKEKIDGIFSDSVVKQGLFGATDIKESTNNDELISSLSTGYVHEFPYAYYGLQSNVPEHINASNLFGT